SAPGRTGWRSAGWEDSRRWDVRGPWASCSPSWPDGSADKVVSVRSSYLDADNVAAAQSLALDPHKAVDLRGVGVRARQHMVGHFRICPIHDHLDLLAGLASGPSKGDLLLRLHEAVTPLGLHEFRHMPVKSGRRRAGLERVGEDADPLEP